MELPKELQEQADELQQRQIGLEVAMVDDGINKFRREVYDDSQPFSTKPAGMVIVREVFESLSKEITRRQKDILNKLKSRRVADEGKPLKHIQNQYMLELSADKLSYLTLKTCMYYGYGRYNSGTLCSTIAMILTTAIRNQIEVETWVKDSQEDKGRNVAKYLLSRAKNFNQRQWNMWQNKLDGLPRLTWSNEDRIKLGIELLDALIVAGQGFFQVNTLRRGVKTKSVLCLTKEARDWVDEYNKESEALHPTRRPSLSTPLPFFWDANKKAYIGGYHIIPNKLMRDESHTSDLIDPLSDSALDAVNNLMRIPFIVDKDISRVAEDCFNTGNGYVDALVSSMPEPLPERLTEQEWELLTEEEQKAHKYHIASIHKRNNSNNTKRYDAIIKFNTIRKYQDEVFYHIVSSDFRSRLYYTSGVWQPQGDELGKATHRFKEKAPMGVDGVFWLKVHLASTFGYDKVSFEDMQGWVDQNQMDIFMSANDPMVNKFWTTADSPLMFLQACNEYREVYNSENPEAFLSNLPIYQDATNNGLQLLSLLGKDPMGAKYTNCSSDPNRYDIYEVVAERVREILKASDDELATYWVDKINRSICKRASMTKAYGVTTFGIRQQLIDDGFIASDEPKAMQKSLYLANILVDVLDNTLEKASSIMDYFQGVGRLLAESGEPLRWTTPSGSFIQQKYNKVKLKRVNTILGKLSLKKSTDNLSIRNQTLGSSPNIVHSIDASILHNVINELNDNDVRGIVSIHDSFGVHAGNVGLLRDTIRKVVYDIFSEDWLGGFHNNLLERYPDIEFPELPVTGSFDVSEVLKARYFFA